MYQWGFSLLLMGLCVIWVILYNLPVVLLWLLQKGAAQGMFIAFPTCKLDSSPQSQSGVLLQETWILYLVWDVLEVLIREKEAWSTKWSAGLPVKRGYYFGTEWTSSCWWTWGPWWKTMRRLIAVWLKTKRHTNQKFNRRKRGREPRRTLLGSQ